MAGRKTPTLHVLTEHGVVHRGTEIEMLPRVLPANAADCDPRAFRATIEDPLGGELSIRWALDGELYSLSTLTDDVKARFGGKPNVGKYFANWRRVGAEESLHHEAERYPR